MTGAKVVIASIRRALYYKQIKLYCLLEGMSRHASLPNMLSKIKVVVPRANHLRAREILLANQRLERSGDNRCPAHYLSLDHSIGHSCHGRVTIGSRRGWRAEPKKEAGTEDVTNESANY